MNRIAAVTLLLMLPGLTIADDPANQPETSKNIGYGAYQNSSGRVELIVGAQAAAISQHEQYIPLQVALAVRGKGPELEVSMSRFALIDASGNILDPATVEEMAKQAGLIQYMTEYRKTSPLPLGNQFSGQREIVSNFYPLDGGKFYVEEHLGHDAYLRDVIFFPTPEPGLAGVMTLQFLTPGMDEPVEVRFEAPVKQTEKAAKKKTKKD